MPLSLTSTAIHAIGVALFGYSLYYDLMFVTIPPELLAKNKNLQDAEKWPGKWKYLTLWNLVILSTYQVVALLNDFIGSSELRKNRQTFIQKLRDVFFASWVFPTGMFVCTSYWGLTYMGDQYVNTVEGWYPNWLDQFVHTVPLAFVNLEVVLFPRSQASMLLTCGLIVFATVVYILWIVWIHQHTNTWPYPVLDILGTTERAIFIGAAGVIILMFYFLGEALTRWRWGADVPVSEKRKKKSK